MDEMHEKSNTRPKPTRWKEIENELSLRCPLLQTTHIEQSVDKSGGGSKAIERESSKDDWARVQLHDVLFALLPCFPIAKLKKKVKCNFLKKHCVHVC